MVWLVIYDIPPREVTRYAPKSNLKSLKAEENSPPTRVPSWRLDHLQNIGDALAETAARLPDQIAVASPAHPRPTQVRVRPDQRLSYARITFADLERRTRQIAAVLQAAGVRPGTRMALMIPPGIDFVAHVFALFQSGAVSILIDPGMGRKNLVNCLSAAEPEGLVGIRKAHLARWIFRRRLKKCTVNVCSDGWMPGCWRSDALDNVDELGFNAPAVDRESPAAIIFTTGSTGPPKGVLYRQRNFIQQAQQIRDYFDLQPGGVDISGFPLFALFNTAMGITTVFPAMDATKPAEIYPPNLIDAARQFSATQSFGSPALWNTVSTYCQQNSITLPTVKSVFTAGAPVPPRVLRAVKSVIAADGDVYTPYGATEALPVACNSATVVLAETGDLTDQGQGTCIGERFSEIQWRVIEISDSPIATIDQVRDLPDGQIGELIVKGSVVTDRYVTRTEANADHKITDGDSFWHRMGDVGYLDDQNRFWFCGRKGHRIRTPTDTMFTVPCEAIANTHPQVYRSALVGAGAPGQQQPVMIVQPFEKYWPTSDDAEKQLIDELTQTLAQNSKTQSIQHILLRRTLPVDIRHNSKIFREQLKPWAEQQLKTLGGIP